MNQTPTIGRIVHYKLSEQDVQRLGEAAARAGVKSNPHDVGQALPAIIVRVWPDGTRAAGLINLQALTDGPMTLWITSIREGTAPGEWSWPPRT
jgi:hypothetical protein